MNIHLKKIIQINIFHLDLGWVHQSRVNDHAVKRRVDDILTSRFVQEDLQIEWLARSIQCIDLTTLAGNLSNCQLRLDFKQWFSNFKILGISGTLLSFTFFN